MRNAALILGLIGGLMGLVMGMASYGYTEAVERWGEVEGLFEQVANVELIRAVSFLSPLMAIAGAGMAKVRALWGGALLLLAALGMFVGYGVNALTLFPMGFCAVAGIMALAAGKPDEPKAHF